MNPLNKTFFLVAVAIFVGTLPLDAEDATASAGRVVRLMREMQARITSLGMAESQWPACLNGLPAPAYPSDEFYTSEMDDPVRAAQLVEAIRGVYYLPPAGTPLHRSFLNIQDGDIEGQPDLPANYTDSDGFSASAPADASNWNSVLAEMEANVAKLRFYRRDPSSDLFSRSGHGFLPDFSHLQPESAVWAATLQAAVADYGASTPLLLEGQTGLPWQDADMWDITLGAHIWCVFGRFRLGARGASAIAIYAKLDHAWEWVGGTADPPIPDDAKYHLVADVEPGSEWVQDLWPDLTVSLTPNNGSTAEWQIESIVGIAEVIPPQADDSITCCDGCSDCQPGTAIPELDGLNLRVDLGGDGSGRSAGYLQLRAEAASPQIATPAAILARVGDAATVTRDVASGDLQRIETTNTVVDVVPISAFKYEIRFSHVGGAGFKTITVENPAASAEDYSVLRITESDNAHVSEFAFDSTQREWELSTAGGARKERLSTQWSQARTVKTETRTVLDQDDTILEKTERAYTRMAWGLELTGEVLDPDGAALTRTWTYYVDAGQDGGAYRRQKTYTDEWGHWQRWEYYPDGRLQKQVSQLQSAAVGAPDNQCRVISYSYSPDNTQTTIVEFLLGQEVGRRYTLSPAAGEVREIVCTSAGAAVDDPANLTTTTRRLTTGDFEGRVSSVAKPDGTMTIYLYENLAGGGVRTTEASGQPDGNGSSIVAGLRTITEQNAWGGQVSIDVTDIASGLPLSSADAVAGDQFGRATQIVFEDGSSELRSYDCCGVDMLTDRTGVVTNFEHDVFGNMWRETRDGVTTESIYDAAGRVQKTIRRGTDDSAIVQDESVYDTAGRVASRKDAMLRITSFTEAMVDGMRVKTSTFPDGSTRIEKSHPDGSIAEVSGSAAHRTKWEYGADADGQYVKEIRATDQGEGEWVKRYTDIAGREWKTVYPDGASSMRHFNSIGQVRKEIDPDGVTTLYAYGPAGELEVVALDVNTNDQIDYGTDDRITRTSREVANAHGAVVTRTTTEQWTESGPVTTLQIEETANGLFKWETAHGLTTQTTTTVGGNGQSTQIVTHPDGSAVTSTYDAGRIVSTSRSDTGVSLVYQYDAHNRLWQQTDARNGTTTTTYYNDDRVASVSTPPPAQTRGYHYDARGQTDYVELPDGSQTNYDFSPAGDLVSVSGAQVLPQTLTYDGQGRIRSLAVGASGATTWQYHPQRGWLARKQFADGNGTDYTYTPAGRIHQRTWARGVVTTYGYDTTGLVESVGYSDATTAVTHVRDRLGKIVSVSDAAGS